MKKGLLHYRAKRTLLISASRACASLLHIPNGKACSHALRWHMTQLTIIAAVLESYEVVRRQLLHLERIIPPNCEMILVDDGSVPSLQQTCASVFTSFRFRLVCTNDPRPWTQPRARNIGA